MMSQKRREQRSQQHLNINRDRAQSYEGSSSNCQRGEYDEHFLRPCILVTNLRDKETRYRAPSLSLSMHFIFIDHYFSMGWDRPVLNQQRPLNSRRWPIQ